MQEYFARLCPNSYVSVGFRATRGSSFRALTAYDGFTFLILFLGHGESRWTSVSISFIFDLSLALSIQLIVLLIGGGCFSKEGLSAGRIFFFRFSAFRDAANRN